MDVRYSSPESPVVSNERDPESCDARIHRRRRTRDWLLKTLGEPFCRKLGLFRIPETLTLSVVSRSTTSERQSTKSCGGCAPSRSRSRSSWSTIVRGMGPARFCESWKSSDGDLKVIFHEINQGKGAALRTGFRYATGDIVIVQDADLEYEPEQYPELIQPIVDDQADVVFGSRFIGETHRVLYFWHSLANKFLTLLSNMFTNLNLTDMEVCYKVFRREVIQGIKLEERPVRLRARGHGQGGAVQASRAETASPRGRAASTRFPWPITAGLTAKARRSG